MPSSARAGNASTAFARVMAYDARRPITSTVNNSCVGLNGRTALAGGTDIVDFGMSPGVQVSDFISNTGIRVQSIATNFNGDQRGARRLDLLLDADLRLKATSCTLAANLASCLIGAPGMDMNYFHDFLARRQLCPELRHRHEQDNRLLFAARPDPSIDVFDTFDGGQLLTPACP